MKNNGLYYHQKEHQKNKLTDLWSSISLISEIGSLKYTGRGASATEDVGIFNQIEEERHWNFVIVQLRNGPWTHGSVKIVGCWSLKTVSNFEPSPFNKLKSKALTIFVKVMYILQCTSISYYERRNCYFYFIQYFFFDNDFKFQSFWKYLFKYTWR